MDRDGSLTTATVPILIRIKSKVANVKLRSGRGFSLILIEAGRPDSVARWLGLRFAVGDLRNLLCHRWTLCMPI